VIARKQEDAPAEKPADAGDEPAKDDEPAGPQDGDTGSDE
jgi:hypothetical protein